MRETDAKLEELEVTILRMRMETETKDREAGVLQARLEGEISKMRYRAKELEEQIEAERKDK